MKKLLLLICMKMAEGLVAISFLTFAPLWVGHRAENLGFFIITKKDFIVYWGIGALVLLILTGLSLLLYVIIAEVIPLWIKWNKKMVNKMVD